MASKITLKNLEQQEFTIQHQDGVGAGTIKSTDITYKIDSVDDFASVPSAFDTVIVKDKDRGGVFNKIASTTANGGTIFDGNGCSWERQYSGAVNVKWFGADFNTFKEYLSITRKVGYIDGDVYIDTDTTIPFNITLEGDGENFSSRIIMTNGATLFVGKQASGSEDIIYGHHVTFRGLTFVDSGSGDTMLNFEESYTTLLDNVRFFGSNNDNLTFVKYSKGRNHIINKCHIDGENSLRGILVDYTASVSVESCDIENLDYGIDVYGDCTISNIYAERNAIYSIVKRASGSLVITGGYISWNTSAYGIALFDDNAVINGVKYNDNNGSNLDFIFVSNNGTTSSDNNRNVNIYGVPHKYIHYDPNIRSIGANVMTHAKDTDEGVFRREYTRKISIQDDDTKNFFKITSIYSNGKGVRVKACIHAMKNYVARYKEYVFFVFWQGGNLTVTSPSEIVSHYHSASANYDFNFNLYTSASAGVAYIGVEALLTGASVNGDSLDTVCTIDVEGIYHPIRIEEP